MMNKTSPVRLIALATLTVALLGVVPAARSADGSPAIIKVSFKLDQRLTRGQYMGDRWVSPPTYTRVLEGKELMVEARAEVLDGKRRSAKIIAKWITADPEMVVISPVEGNAVTITVKRAGECTLKVVAEEVSKDLSIRAMATNEGKVLRVDISQ